MTVRAAGWADVGQVRRIEAETFGRHAFDPLSLLFYLVCHRRGFLVAEREGRVIGYVISACVRRGWQKQGHIASFAVRPDRRGQGVGSELLRRALEWMEQAGCRKITLEVGQDNPGAIQLYRRMGFRPEQALPDYYGLGLNGLRMVRER